MNKKFIIILGWLALQISACNMNISTSVPIFHTPILPIFRTPTFQGGGTGGGGGGEEIITVSAPAEVHCLSEQECGFSVNVVWQNPPSGHRLCVYTHLETVGPVYFYQFQGTSGQARIGDAPTNSGFEIIAVSTSVSCNGLSLPLGKSSSVRVIRINDNGDPLVLKTSTPTPIVLVAPTPSPIIFLTPSKISQVIAPILSIEEQLAMMDAELKRYLQGSLSYTSPVTMKLDETFTVQLLLNPSLAPEELSTLLVEESGLPTSTSASGELVTGSGGVVNVVSNEIEITPRMKAVLLSEDPEAFDIQRLHDDDIQFISESTTTEWQWAIKAKKAGNQRLVIVISRLVKIDGVESWRLIETYKEDINVQVTALQRVKSWDWRWILTPIIVAMLTWLGTWFWRWYDERKKQNSANTNVKPKKTTKPSQKGKK